MYCLFGRGFESLQLHKKENRNDSLFFVPKVVPEFFKYIFVNF